jgi:1-acyl-sn-glycerol-3-phosphate acyltransferase
MLSDEQTRLLAVCVLALVGLALAIAALRTYQHFRFTPLQFPLYMYNLFMTRVIWRVAVEGRVTLPLDQGAVIVCNHRSPIDPAFVALACDRQVHWMVAREYCKHPLVGWALKILQVIPTGRGGIDTASTKLAIRYAQQGDLVGMFPEGRINTTSNLMLPGRPGVAFVALKTRVPVVPCYITGSPYDGNVFSFLFITARTRLRVGRPIDLGEFYGREGDREVLEELTRRFLCEIARLAGVLDYLPELAGKRSRQGAAPDEALEPVADEA